jgi:hypothetical protein
MQKGVPDLIGKSVVRLLAKGSETANFLMPQSQLKVYFYDSNIARYTTGNSRAKEN